MDRFAIIYLLALVVFWSCKSDSSVREEILLGNWEVVEAKRNSRHTQTLNGATFEFSEQGKMKTNILGEMVEADFHLEDDLILQDGNDEQITYSILEMSDSTLNLITRLREVPFEFRLRKISGEEGR